MYLKGENEKGGRFHEMKCNLSTAYLYHINDDDILICIHPYYFDFLTPNACYLIF